ncbi:sigma factor-like helix-turn-helix DNA-binding protein [uncultured Granulicatella sp.]|uniref:sigma factor-like helix-turn-helix DNA-binding protein n=1 Tax=uncultured Granulicatella sp. TaxID=316089 RepID=UPI0028D70AB4|nr:sigma factor-like helix-turn-helix DNA-binding protein [uncultured Granulicatella sp.]
MKIHKTKQNKRKVYKYFIKAKENDEELVKQNIVVKQGKDDETELENKLLHSMNDSEIYCGNKNLRATRTKEKQYFIPMEISTQTDKRFVKAHGFTEEDFKWWKIGNRSTLAILIPCTEEEYRAYMRPIWKDMKAEERKKKYFEVNEITETSIERLSNDYGLEIEDTSVDQDKELLLMELKELLQTMEELDQQIVELYLNGYSESAIGVEVGMSQKGVNKRKFKIFEKIKNYLK